MRYSVLDLSPVPEGADAATAIANSVDLAQHAEGWGYSRYWMAEHHNMPGIASAATAVLIAHIAQGTSTIRVGAGGVMLPNHAPLAIAEQFGTLAGLAEADDGVGTAGNGPHRDRIAIRWRVDSVDPKGGKGSVDHTSKRVHQVRLPLSSTRGRVQIGSGLDWTCTMTQRANC